MGNFVIFATLLLLGALTTPPAVRGDGQRRYASPDGHLIVYIVPPRKVSSAQRESRIEVRAKGGARRLSRSFASVDGEHGFRVRRAVWSGDGRYFIFNLESSGGHQPWHLPTLVYSVARNRLYSVDEEVGPVASEFEIVAGGLLRVRRLKPNGEQGQEDVVSVRLRTLQRPPRF